MINTIWVLLILASVFCGALTQNMNEVSTASFEYAKIGVDIVIGLIGSMVFWLGIMGALQKTGLVKKCAKALEKPMTFLFPKVPVTHPAMQYMILNMTANMMGLTNAATPFGLKAMYELHKLSKEQNAPQGEATNAMALFLAINTSAISLLPTGMMVLRSSLGSTNPGAIILPTLFATTMSTIVAIIVAKSCAPLFKMSASLTTQELTSDKTDVAIDHNVDNLIKEINTLEPATSTQGYSSVYLLKLIALLITFIGMGYGLNLALNNSAKDSLTENLVAITGQWMPVLIIVSIVGYAWLKNVDVYSETVSAGKEAISISIKIIPYLVVMLVALGMIRKSGFLDLLSSGLDPYLSIIGLPTEGFFMGIIRTLSGSGSYAYVSEIMTTHGPDSYLGYLVSTMQGSTETTFYVLALYLGSVSITKSRHTLIACLCADLAGFLASIAAVKWLLT